jgi:hypothetical protein
MGRECRGTCKRLGKHAKNTIADSIQRAGDATSDGYTDVKTSYDLYE